MEVAPDRLGGVGIALKSLVRRRSFASSDSDAAVLERCTSGSRSSRTGFVVSGRRLGVADSVRQATDFCDLRLGEITR